MIDDKLLDEAVEQMHLRMQHTRDSEAILRWVVQWAIEKLRRRSAGAPRERETRRALAERERRTIRFVLGQVQLLPMDHLAADLDKLANLHPDEDEWVRVLARWVQPLLDAYELELDRTWVLEDRLRDLEKSLREKMLIANEALRRRTHPMDDYDNCADQEDGNGCDAVISELRAELERRGYTIIEKSSDEEE